MACVPLSGLVGCVIARGGRGDPAFSTFLVQAPGVCGGGAERNLGREDSRLSLSLCCRSQGCAFPVKSSL